MGIAYYDDVAHLRSAPVLRTLLRMRRSVKTAVLAVGLLILAATMACSNGSSKGAASPTRGSAGLLVQGKPAGVPATARAAMDSVTLGTEDTNAVAADQLRVFDNLACADGLLIVATSRESLYAELPCDRSPPDAAVRPFVATAVQLGFVAGQPAKLFVESKAAGTIQFSVPGIWIDAR